MTRPPLARVFAATGHRPDKLGGYDLGVRHRAVALAIDFMRRESPDRVISGMALGWDWAWATAALRLGIPVTAAVPFDGHYQYWNEITQRNYMVLLRKCTEVIYVCTPGYSAKKMQRRNEWMVDRASRVVALWDGSDGGTANCVRYAWGIQKPVTNLWPEWLSAQAAAPK